MFGGTEAHHLQEAYARPPGPPGPQKQAKKHTKKSKASKNIFFCRISCGIFFKDNISSSKKLEQLDISLLKGLSSGGTHLSILVI